MIEMMKSADKHIETGVMNILKILEHGNNENWKYKK